MKKEIELKYQLANKDDFYIFESFVEQYRCDKKRQLLQKNTYFDTPALELRRAGISLRLREQNNEYILSAKQSLRDKRMLKHLSVRLEYESKLDRNMASYIIDDHLSPLDAFLYLRSSSSMLEDTKRILYSHMKKAISTGLQIVGSFTNMRTNIPILIGGHKLHLELDHSRYPTDIEIYEVEVEFSGLRQVASLQPAIERLFRLAGVRTHRSSSKSSRLYRILFGKA